MSDAVVYGSRIVADTIPLAALGADADSFAQRGNAGLLPATLDKTTILAATSDPAEATAVFTLTDGDLRLYAIYLPSAATLTGVGWCQTTQGDTTADNENRIGLFASDGTDLALVASSADDGTLWEQAAGIRTKAFSAPYAAAA